MIAPWRAPLEARLTALASTAVLGLPQRHIANPAGSAPEVAHGAAQLQEMLAGQITSGGKRLRGLLPVAVVAACQGPVAAALELGACVELVHNGTLVHDDVQDNDRLRRGRPTLWAIHGMPQAINVGDALLVAPIALLLRAACLPAASRADIALLLAEALVETVRGQVADIALRDTILGLPDDAPITLAQLTAVHVAKTAPLFGVCLQGAAILLDGTQHQQAAAQACARALGLAFQVRDDLLDMVGTKGRGDAGADLREGKVTAPLLLAMADAPPAQCAALRQVLRQAAATDGIDDRAVANWVQWTTERGGTVRASAWLDELLAQAQSTGAAAFGAQGAAVIAAVCARLAHLDG